MGKFDYRAKQSVTAAQWLGDNLDEMRELLYDLVEKDEDGIPMVYADWMEPYFYSHRLKSDGYFVLKTEIDEFDPGMWIVVYDNHDYEGVSDEEFHKMFEKA